jgi:hypothetical protein
MLCYTPSSEPFRIYLISLLSRKHIARQQFPLCLSAFPCCFSKQNAIYTLKLTDLRTLILKMEIPCAYEILATSPTSVCCNNTRQELTSRKHVHIIIWPVFSYWVLNQNVNISSVRRCCMLKVRLQLLTFYSRW